MCVVLFSVFRLILAYDPFVGFGNGPGSRQQIGLVERFRLLPFAVGVFVRLAN